MMAIAGCKPCRSKPNARLSRQPIPPRANTEPAPGNPVERPSRHCGYPFRHGDSIMFYQDKKLMFDVNVSAADPQFAQMLLEQFGGATGELSAALTYWTQSFHVENKGIRDMLQDIAIEEFSHLEMVGRMIEQLTEK